ncbi:two-component system response regulator KdpE (plasmid) [Duffyella gerundensis]|jgi:two-component system KDP operon response regulator KdpE|uniref:KDP operon transcriptional regulatory protein KdpE n=1 Tax=Duffyella gerundensis TaxID=1619313 RepID=A0A0U5L5M2_9GAMM|nr:two-component system response regulator KdpE [Duffyella gerundensis]QTO56201.1 two-component system response regulator KdpE [Duffyella gerundensis]UCB33112.1 two-component system response regulator KdpE [Duffyella gerundensis]CUU26121.1 KDP operon transcriptional regulatory protein KdpE [Duffyella gerundensis]
MKTLLVIDDEKQICRFLRQALEKEGETKVYEADTLAHGLTTAAARRPDLVILDLGLPDGDGMSFIRQFRLWSDRPIIVLSARTDEDDKIQALDAGADDFLCKPFGMGELQARVRVALRRHETDKPQEIAFGDISVNLTTSLVTRAGELVHLTPTEFRLLALMITNPGKVLTQKHILRQIWGPNADHNSQYLRIYMGHLRQKLENSSAQPQHFITENGVGYRFVQ